jgi:hypothetical protein
LNFKLLLFQQLVNKMCLQYVCSQLFNRLWQCCSNNFSTRFVSNMFVASLLISCDNAVPTTCQKVVFALGLLTMLFQQLNKMWLQSVFSQLVNKLWQCCSKNLSTPCVSNTFVASLLISCDKAVPTTCQQDLLPLGL